LPSLRRILTISSWSYSTVIAGI